MTKSHTFTYEVHEFCEPGKNGHCQQKHWLTVFIEGADSSKPHNYLIKAPGDKRSKSFGDFMRQELPPNLTHVAKEIVKSTNGEAAITNYENWRDKDLSRAYLTGEGEIIIRVGISTSPAQVIYHKEGSGGAAWIDNVLEEVCNLLTADSSSVVDKKLEMEPGEYITIAIDRITKEEIEKLPEFSGY